MLKNNSFRLSEIEYKRSSDHDKIMGEIRSMIRDKSEAKWKVELLNEKLNSMKNQELKSIIDHHDSGLAPEKNLNALLNKLVYVFGEDEAREFFKGYCKEKGMVEDGISNRKYSNKSHFSKKYLKSEGDLQNWDILRKRISLQNDFKFDYNLLNNYKR